MDQRKLAVMTKLESTAQSAKALAEHQEGQANTIARILDPAALFLLGGAGLDADQWRPIRKSVGVHFPSLCSLQRAAASSSDSSTGSLDSSVATVATGRIPKPSLEFLTGFGLFPKTGRDAMSLDASSLGGGSLMDKLERWNMKSDESDDESTIETKDGPPLPILSTPSNRMGRS